MGNRLGLPWQSVIKSHAERLLYPGDGGPHTPLKLDIPTAVEILDFREGVHPGPVAGRLRVDTTSGPNSVWNLRACQVFAQDFCAKRYPEAEGKTLMDASHEFYRLIPTFISRQATGSGFADTQSYERFQESVAKHIRRHRVISSLFLSLQSR